MLVKDNEQQNIFLFTIKYSRQAIKYLDQFCIFRIRMNFIAKYAYTHKEFVLVTEASEYRQNDSDKTQVIKIK